MANYAVIDNGTVINTIVAESQEVAAEITGLTVLEYTEENPLGINWYWDATADAYITPSPYASWVYDYTAKSWKAPVDMPVEEGKAFTWDEATVSWIASDVEA
jgi:hypothetical protein